MILLLYAVLGCWGTVQCVGIGGDKEMWSKKIKKFGVLVLGSLQGQAEQTTRILALLQASLQHRV